MERIVMEAGAKKVVEALISAGYDAYAVGGCVRDALLGDVPNALEVARAMLQALYTYYTKHPEKLPADFIPQLDFDGMPRVICDYIAGMTDKYAVAKYEEIFIPSAWHVRG